MGKLYYGDNLDVLRSGKIKERSVDVCYIDPPFNSQRTYNLAEFRAIGIARLICHFENRNQL